MEAEVFEALRSIGIADDKASAAAQALRRQDPDMTGLKADVAALKIDVAGLKTDVAVGKWMLGFVAAGMVALLLKAFMH